MEDGGARMPLAWGSQNRPRVVLPMALRPLRAEGVGLWRGLEGPSMGSAKVMRHVGLVSRPKTWVGGGKQELSQKTYYVFYRFLDHLSWNLFLSNGHFDWTDRQVLDHLLLRMGPGFFSTGMTLQAGGKKGIKRCVPMKPPDCPVLHHPIPTTPRFPRASTTPLEAARTGVGAACRRASGGRRTPGGVFRPQPEGTTVRWNRSDD